MQEIGPIIRRVERRVQVLNITPHTPHTAAIVQALPFELLPFKKPAGSFTKHYTKLFTNTVML